MRKPLAVCAVLAAAAMLGGCHVASRTDGTSGSLEANDLRVRMDVPRTHFVRGETFQVAVTVKNTTGHAIQIVANTGAPVYVRLSRDSALGWETVKRFPEVATMVMKTWTLEAGAQRTFAMDLTVEPDWPTYEPLKLTAEVNGRDEPRPSVQIDVRPRASP